MAKATISGVDYYQCDECFCFVAKLPPNSEKDLRGISLDALNNADWIPYDEAPWLCEECERVQNE